MKDSRGHAARSYKINRELQWRFDKTIEFVEKHLESNASILDIGESNLLSKIIEKKGYNIENTPPNVDLDINYDSVNKEADCVTAFEILEHLVSPFPLLRNIKAKKLIASVPLKLWFSSAYWNEDDEFDRHYHEFEPRQLDMLLDKSGWIIKHSEKWKPPLYKIGIRPVLRSMTDRYYIVYAERN